MKMKKSMINIVENNETPSGLYKLQRMSNFEKKQI